MTAAREPRGSAGHQELVLPDQLSVWLDGEYSDGRVAISDDGRLVDGFTIPDWVDDIRLGYPRSVLAATFAGSRGPEQDAASSEGWQELIARAAAVNDRGSADLGANSSFRGDTTPTSLRSLRRWVMSRLDALPEICDDAVLVVSELATNVERHAPSWMTIDLSILDTAVLLAVTDPVVEHLPQPRSVSIEDTAGRGLLVVATLSAVWGVVVRPATKTVWAAFDLSAT